jgi:hypothetical protein
MAFGLPAAAHPFLVVSVLLSVGVSGAIPAPTASAYVPLLSRPSCAPGLAHSPMHARAHLRRTPPVRAAASRDPLEAGAIEDAEELARQRERERLRALSEHWLTMCAAVSLSDESGLQPFTTPTGWLSAPSPPPVQEYSREEIIAAVEKGEPALSALLDACEDRAPSLCSASASLPLGRLAAWTAGRWVRPLDEWAGEAGEAEDDVEADGDDSVLAARERAAAREGAALRSLCSHLLEKWEVPASLHTALAYADGPPISEACHRISRAFVEAHVDAGSGDAAVLASLRNHFSPGLTKAMAKHFVAASPTPNPLHALRRAQVRRRHEAPSVPGHRQLDSLSPSPIAAYPPTAPAHRSRPPLPPTRPRPPAPPTDPLLLRSRRWAATSGSPRARARRASAVRSSAARRTRSTRSSRLNGRCATRTRCSLPRRRG